MNPANPKTRRARSWVLVVGIAGALLAAACASDPVRTPPVGDLVGEQLAPFSLEDQHGQTRSIDTSTRLILYSRDMDGGDIVKPVLEPLGDDYLASEHAVYIADISKMPRLISKMIAIPRMRSRSYRTLLDLDGSVTSILPSQPGRATVLRLEKLRVVDSQTVGSIEELRDVLGL